MNAFTVYFFGLNRVITNGMFLKYSCQLPSTLVLNKIVNVNDSQKRFAGHAKWQNIAHTKAKTDAIKAKLHNTYALKLRKAVREGGGSVNPAVNVTLKSVIEEAKRMNVRKEVIERALHSMSNLKIEPHIVEAIGPGGCFLLISCETDNVSILRHDIKKAMKKSKCALAREGVARFAFQEKGFIRIAKNDCKGVPLTFEKMEELAIEAGAEEVIEEEIDEENAGIAESNANGKKTVWLITTAGEDFYGAKKYFEKASDIEIISADLECTATNTLELEKDDVEMLSQVINQLEDMPAIVRVYTNVKGFH